MTLYLLRHADAGDRAAWTGDDRSRPLSATGRVQSEAVAELLSDRNLDVVLSGPARRCKDTVEPLAVARGLPVEEDDALAEGAPFDLLDRLLRRFASQDALMCSHADVIGSALTALWRAGHLPDRPNARKVATWVLEGWPDPARIEVIDPPTPG